MPLIHMLLGVANIWKGKLLEVANLNRPPPVKMFLEEQNYKHNIEFNYMASRYEY